MLLKMMEAAPLLFSNIIPKHLMEKEISLASVKNNKAHATLFDKLLINNKDLKIIVNLMSDEFIKTFDTKIIFLNSNKLLYALCNSPFGNQKLKAIIQKSPQVARSISKELFYKCIPELTENNSIFMSLLNKKNKPAITESLVLLDLIIKASPLLINLPIKTYSKLNAIECLEKLIAMQVGYINPNITSQQQESIKQFEIEARQIYCDGNAFLSLMGC